jgi:RNAse (barnase) inhibitor barstar
MDQLALRLKDVKEAGVYLVTCELDDVRAAAKEAGFALFDVDLSNVHSKSEFLAAIAQAIAAPEWFGKNWDALADALSDLSWKNAPGYVLLLVHSTEHFNLLGNDHDVAKEILETTVEFWKSQNKPFWVFTC